MCETSCGIQHAKLGVLISLAMTRKVGKTGRTGRKFSVKKFMVNGRSEAEADAAALEAAKAFHAELVRKGILKQPKEQDPNFTSDVPGVMWSQADEEVASGDFFEEKQSKGTTEKDFRAAISPIRQRPRPRPGGSKSCTACNAR